MNPSAPPDTPRPPDARFTATNWNLVLLAGREDTVRAEGALAELCGRYWYPLYAYARRAGWAAEDAEDATLEFSRGCRARNGWPTPTRRRAASARFC